MRSMNLPKADVRRRNCDVRFVRKSEIKQTASLILRASFVNPRPNSPVGSRREQRRR